MPDQSSTTERRNTLIVDDDRMIAKAVGVRMEAAGFRTNFAHDGLEALETVIRDKPDAVVLDIRMPKLDGLSVLAALQERDDTKHIPIIMLSASAVDERRALDAGAFCFLHKPYNAQSLLRAMNMALTGKNEANRKA